MNMAAELAWPDTGPDYEWRRESLLEMDVEPPLAAVVPEPEPAVTPTGCPAMASGQGRTYVCWLMPEHPGPHYDAIGHTHWRDGRKVTHWHCADEPAAPVEKPRCKRCRYLTTRCSCPGGPRS